MSRAPKLAGNVAAYDYNKAIDFANSFNPQSDCAYGWVYEHSLSLYNQTSESINDLDKKADNMIKYLVPGSGLLGLFVSYIALSRGNFMIGLYAFIGIIFVIGALIYAVSALMPSDYALLPSVKSALNKADNYPQTEQAKAKFASIIAIAISGQLSAIEYKYKKVDISYILFIYSIIWLFLLTPIFAFYKLYL